MFFNYYYYSEQANMSQTSMNTESWRFNGNSIADFCSKSGDVDVKIQYYAPKIAEKFALILPHLGWDRLQSRLGKTRDPASHLGIIV